MSYKSHNLLSNHSLTFIATALTAGLVAYFMGLGESDVEARDYLYLKAHPRSQRGLKLKVIWNDVDTRDLAPQAPPPPPGPTAPYAEGTCSFHLTEWREGIFSRFSVPRFTVEVTMYDDKKNQIGHVDRTSASMTLNVRSKLQNYLLITTKGIQGVIDFRLCRPNMGHRHL